MNYRGVTASIRPHNDLLLSSDLIIQLAGRQSSHSRRRCRIHYGHLRESIKLNGITTYNHYKRRTKTEAENEEVEKKDTYLGMIHMEG